MVYLWLGLIVAFIAVEAATVNLVSVWFIGGAVAGLICEILGASALLQVTVFLLVSAVLPFMPQSIKIFVFPSDTKVQLPLLPLAKV